MPKLGQVKRASLHPAAEEVFKRLFGDRDPTVQPGTASGTRGNWWTVFANSKDIFDHAVAGFQFFRSPDRKLDLKLREHMKIELKQLQAAFGTTFVYITHDQSEALVLSDHVGVMSHGRFEQLGTPQDLYYRPQTPFVAGFVGANNRIVGRTTRADGPIAEIATADGWVVRALKAGSIAAGDAVEVFVRPEVAMLARNEDELPSGQPWHAGEVQSLLFDGANSAVLLQETRSRREFRIALPQTGQFSDLKPQEKVLFSFDPSRAVCFAARPGAAGLDG